MADEKAPPAPVVPITEDDRPRSEKSEELADVLLSALIQRIKDGRAVAADLAVARAAVRDAGVQLGKHGRPVGKTGELVAALGEVDQDEVPNFKH